MLKSNLKISFQRPFLRYDVFQSYGLLPSLKRAILGEDGGKGNILDLAVSVASISKPANTVQRLSEFFHFVMTELHLVVHFLPHILNRINY